MCDRRGKKCDALHGSRTLSWHRSRTLESTSVSQRAGRQRASSAREAERCCWSVATTIPRKPAPHPSSSTRRSCTSSRIQSMRVLYRGRWVDRTWVSDQEFCKCNAGLPRCESSSSSLNESTRLQKRRTRESSTDRGRLNAGGVPDICHVSLCRRPDSNCSTAYVSGASSGIVQTARRGALH